MSNTELVDLMFVRMQIIDEENVIKAFEKKLHELKAEEKELKMKIKKSKKKIKELKSSF